MDDSTQPGGKRQIIVAMTVVVVVAVVGTYLLTRSKAATTVNGSRAPYVCNSPYPTLHKGAHGECVKYVQWTLDNYFGQTLPIDGELSDATFVAITKLPTLSSAVSDSTIGYDAWELFDAQTATGDNGTLRAGCKNFSLNGQSSLASVKASTSYTLSTQWKNVGPSTWPNTSVNFAWNGYGSTPFESLGAVKTNKKSVVSSELVTATSQVKFKPGNYTLQATLFDGSALPGAEGQNLDNPIGPVCTKTINVE